MGKGDFAGLTESLSGPRGPPCRALPLPPETPSSPLCPAPLAAGPCCILLPGPAVPFSPAPRGSLSQHTQHPLPPPPNLPIPSVSILAAIMDTKEAGDWSRVKEGIAWLLGGEQRIPHGFPAGCVLGGVRG